MNALQYVAEFTADNKNLPYLIYFTLLFPVVMYMIGCKARDIISAMPKRIFRRL